MRPLDFDDDDGDLAVPACNVVWLRQREKTDPPAMYELPYTRAERFPVDIRGNIAFGRLLSGLSTVGLTVRIDSGSGRIVITDDVEL